ncbi:MAG: hypothetical protein AB7O28_17665 [Vicinamibacterales bacterium]
MASRTRKWLPIVAGVAILLVFVVIGLAAVSVAWFRQNLDVTHGASRTEATRAFDDARRQYADQRPIVEFGDDRRPEFVKGIETRKNAGSVSAIHVLAWDADEDALVSLSIPMWLLRLKRGPIMVGEYVSGFDDRGVRLTPEDLEKYGPGVVFEYESRSGDRVLLTTQ